jgi:hypothetical protein
MAPGKGGDDKDNLLHFSGEVKGISVDDDDVHHHHHRQKFCSVMGI